MVRKLEWLFISVVETRCAMHVQSYAMLHSYQRLVETLQLSKFNVTHEYLFMTTLSADMWTSRDNIGDQ